MGNLKIHSIYSGYKKSTKNVLLFPRLINNVCRVIILFFFSPFLDVQENRFVQSEEICLFRVFLEFLLIGKMSKDDPIKKRTQIILNQSF